MTSEPAVKDMPGEDTGRAGAPLGDKHEPPTSTTSAALIKRAPLPKAVAAYVLSDDEMRRTWRMASALAASHLFKDTRDAEVAFGKILVGRDLGLTPTQALQSIDFVEGAIFLRGVLLASLVRKSREYHYKVLSRTSDGCRLFFLGYPADAPPEGEQIITPELLAQMIAAPATYVVGGYIRSAGQWWEVLSDERFTVEDARRAQLVKADKPKSGWMAYPKNMCFWRCISNAVKMEAADLMGGVPVYTEADEIPVAPALGDGQGDGHPVGLDLGPDVEKIIARAKDLGHAALSDVATIEMLLGDQPPAKVAEWVKAATVELDKIPQDAEVVETESGHESPEEPEAANPPSAPGNGPQAPRDRAEAPDSRPPLTAAQQEAIAALRLRGEQLQARAEAADEAGRGDEADELHAEREVVAAQVEAMGDPSQETLAI